MCARTIKVTQEHIHARGGPKVNKDQGCAGISGIISEDLTRKLHAQHVQFGALEESVAEDASHSFYLCQMPILLLRWGRHCMPLRERARATARHCSKRQNCQSQGATL